MIRIRLHDGDIVYTHLHTYAQATAARAGGMDLEVGGPTDNPAGIDDAAADLLPGVDDYPSPVPARRTISAAAIASIEEVR